MSAQALEAAPVVSASNSPVATARVAQLLAVALIALVSAEFQVWGALLRFQAVDSGVDLAIFSQAVRGWADGTGPLLTIKSLTPFSQLGDHFSPILALLAPFWQLWPDPRMLLVAQAVLFAVAVVILGWFATSRIGWFGALVALGFAFSWGMLAAADYDFHEVAFVVPLVVVALVALLRRWDALFIAACVLLLLCKEDTPFLIAGMGLVLIARGRRRFGLWVVGASIAAFLLLVFVVVPAFNPVGAYDYLSGASGADGPLGNVLAALARPETWLYAIALLAVAGLGALSPVMLATVPVILSRLVMAKPSYLSMEFHYAAPLMAVCFVALVDAAERMRSGRLGIRRQGPVRVRWRRPLLIAQAVVLAGIAALSFGLSGLWQDAQFGMDCQTRSATSGAWGRCVAASDLGHRIPDGATAAVDDYLAPQLVTRVTVERLSPTWTDALGQPLDPDWVIVDTSGNSRGDWDDEPNWQTELYQRLVTSGAYTVETRETDYVLLRRVGS